MPLFAIDLRSDASDVAVELERPSPPDVPEVIRRRDPDPRIVPEPGRVADAGREAVELRDRSSAGPCGHPGNPLEAVPEDRVHVLDQVQDPGASLGREVAPNVQPAERFPDRLVDQVRRLLPPWLGFLLAQKASAEEVEILALEPGVEVGGAVVHQVPRQVGLPRAERGRPEKSIYAVEELGLPKDDTTDLACSPESQVFFPPEAGVPPRDRLDGDRVVVLVGVAKVDPAAARPGQRGLDRQDRLGRASCPSGAHSRQYERPLDVEPIRPSKRRESVLKVVVAIGEREATLAQVERVHRALLFVRSDARREDRTDPLAVELRHYLDEPLDRADGLDGRQVLQDRTDPQRRPAIRVQGRGEERPDLALCGVSRILTVFRGFVEESVEEEEVPLSKLVERTPTGLVLGYGVGIDPSTRGVSVEILRRDGGGIHVLERESRNRDRRIGRAGKASARRGGTGSSGLGGRQRSVLRCAGS